MNNWRKATFFFVIIPQFISTVTGEFYTGPKEAEYCNDHGAKFGTPVTTVKYAELKANALPASRLIKLRTANEWE